MTEDNSEPPAGTSETPESETGVRSGIRLGAPTTSRLVGRAVLRGGAVVASATVVTAIGAAWVGIDQPSSAAVVIGLFFSVVVGVGWIVAGWAPADPLVNAALAGGGGFVTAATLGTALSAARGSTVDAGTVLSIPYYGLLTAVAALGGAFARARKLRQDERDRWSGGES